MLATQMYRGFHLDKERGFSNEQEVIAASRVRAIKRRSLSSTRLSQGSQSYKGFQLNKEPGVSNEQGVPAEQRVSGLNEQGVPAEQGVRGLK